MRKDFEDWFPTGHSLRDLAKDLAMLNGAKAEDHGICSDAATPCNLLANGIATGWHPVKPHSLNDWISRKGSSKMGFTSTNPWGAALLFDPFVDATLWTCYRINNGFHSTTVIVLTDFGPINWIIDEAVRMNNSDYGEAACLEFLAATKVGRTGNNLIKVVTGRTTIDKVRANGQAPKLIEEHFGQKRILLWNYFPFQRGDVFSCGRKGLPDLFDSKWYAWCDCVLERFLSIVNPNQVLWCTNSDVSCYRNSLRTVDFGNSRNPYKHPASWGKRVPAPNEISTSSNLGSGNLKQPN